jgi:hypothetical protein
LTKRRVEMKENGAVHFMGHVCCLGMGSNEPGGC